MTFLQRRRSRSSWLHVKARRCLLQQQCSLSSHSERSGPPVLPVLPLLAVFASSRTTTTAQGSPAHCLSHQGDRRSSLQPCHMARAAVSSCGEPLQTRSMPRPHCVLSSVRSTRRARSVAIHPTRSTSTPYAVRRLRSAGSIVDRTLRPQVGIAPGFCPIQPKIEGQQRISTNELGT